MKGGKEYPATLPMETMWYVVDDDGNVGIMEYNENGPIPYNIQEVDSFNDALAFGFDGEMVNLTEDQIYDLLEEVPLPKWDSVVRIDAAKKDRFDELCSMYKGGGCISNELGFYNLDCYDLERLGLLKAMVDEAVVLESFALKEVWMHEEWVNDKLVITKNFDAYPYFVYYQPWSSDLLPQRMHVPANPVKIDQVPYVLRDRVHKIPGNFRDLETFQVAQYYPCGAYGRYDPVYTVYGVEYVTYPTPNGTKVYGLCCLSEDVLRFDYDKGRCLMANGEEVPIVITLNALAKLVQQGVAKLSRFE